MDDGILSFLKRRGGVADQTHPDLDDFLTKNKVVLYTGFDPTAESLHVGTLSVIVNLRRFQHFGHTVIAVIGGGTAMLGDPSGRDQERPIRSKEEIERFSESVKAELARLLDPDKTIFLNNFDWLNAVNFIDFLRDVGKEFRVQDMIARESVKRRLERQEGISFTEFGYQIFQAYDFLHLFKHNQCVLQMGGSDQWGNITAGIDLIRTNEGKSAFGITTHLIARADGRKFSQSEGGGNIWLSAVKTDVHEFYQFWFQTDDADFRRFVLTFTDIDGPELDSLIRDFERDPSNHAVRDRFAFEMTKLVHGDEAARGAMASAQILRTGRVTDETAAYAPKTVLSRDQLGAGFSVADAFVAAGLLPAKKEVKRRAQAGGVFVNGEKIDDALRPLSHSDFDASGRCLLLFGRKKLRVLTLEGNPT